jgi:cephalosporin hydroxylase
MTHTTKHSRVRLILTALSVTLVILTIGTLVAWIRMLRSADSYAERLNTGDGFHNYYYEQEVWKKTRWLGVEIFKLPLDLFVYQELLYELKPDVVVEAGTLYGGSAYFFATMMDQWNKGKVVTIDIEEQPNRPQHPRITYLLGSSTSPEIFAKVKSLIPDGATVMVVLDSDHSRNHVLNELRMYHPLVSPGHYLIAEDTNVNGHPVLPGFGPGPWEAVEAFLKENSDFEADRSREKFLVTFNPRGYLRKKR